MTSARFCRYVFRTTEVDPARAFYEAVLGGVADGIVELPPAAVARGARPHWLSILDVGARGGASAVADAMLARGATRLGPPGAAEVVVVRDPGGAMVGLTDARAPSVADVGWHQLNTADAPRAAGLYGELCGWSIADEVDLGVLGRVRPVAWEPSAPPSAGITGIEDRPELHAHWYAFFAVPSLERAIGETVARGGKVVGPFALPGGGRVAACDDPQGAAFGITERGAAART